MKKHLLISVSLFIFISCSTSSNLTSEQKQKFTTECIGNSICDTPKSISTPKNVRIIKSTDTSITVTWDPVAPSSSYQLFIDGKAGPSVVTNSIILENGSYGLTLVKGKSYNIQVQAIYAPSPDEKTWVYSEKSAGISWVLGDPVKQTSNIPGDTSLVPGSFTSKNYFSCTFCDYYNGKYSKIYSSSTFQYNRCVKKDAGFGDIDFAFAPRGPLVGKTTSKCYVDGGNWVKRDGINGNELDWSSAEGWEGGAPEDPLLSEYVNLEHEEFVYNYGNPGKKDFQKYDLKSLLEIIRKRLPIAEKILEKDPNNSKSRVLLGELYQHILTEISYDSGKEGQMDTKIFAEYRFEAIEMIKKLFALKITDKEILDNSGKLWGLQNMTIYPTSCINAISRIYERINSISNNYYSAECLAIKKEIGVKKDSLKPNGVEISCGRIIYGQESSTTPTTTPIQTSTSTQGGNNLSYSAALDYSIKNGNPNGAWSYGWMPNDFSSFNAYTGQTTSSGFILWTSSPSSPSLFRNDSSNTAFGVSPGQISLHPSSTKQPSVLRWTAQKESTYIISGKFYSGDSGEMKVGVRQASNWLWQGTDSGAFNIEKKLSASDTIDFVVYGNYSSGNTPIDVTIKEK